MLAIARDASRTVRDEQDEQDDHGYRDCDRGSSYATHAGPSAPRTRLLAEQAIDAAEQEQIGRCCSRSLALPSLLL